MYNALSEYKGAEGNYLLPYMLILILLLLFHNIENNILPP